MSYERNGRGDGERGERRYDREQEYFFNHPFPAESGLGRFSSSESITALAPALARVFANVKTATKGEENPLYKSKYADLAAVAAACQAALTDAGFAYPQLPRWSNGELWLTTILLHSSGEWISSDYPAFALYFDPQKVGKVLTYARRYHLASMCGVAPEDDDGNGALERPGRGQGRQQPRQQPPDDRAGDPRGRGREAARDFPNRVQPPARTFRSYFHAELAKREAILRADMEREGTPAEERRKWSVWDTDGVLYLRAVNELVSAAIDAGKCKPERVAKDDKPDKRDPEKAREVADLVLKNCPRLTREVIEVYLDEKLAKARDAIGIPDVEAEHAALDRQTNGAGANGHAPSGAN